MAKQNYRTREERAQLKVSVMNLRSQGKGRNEIARELDVPLNTIGRWITEMKGGIVKGDNIDPDKRPATVRTAKKRFILTFAQNNAKVHIPFLDNLKGYANFMDAQLLIGIGRRLKAHDEVHDEVRPFVHNGNLNDPDAFFPIKLKGTPALFLAGVRCGYGTINPVSDIGNGHGVWGDSRAIIMPHPTPALTMVHGINPNEVRQVYSTGSITVPDAGAGKAGFRASSHWFPSALIVEIDGNHIWVRQLEGDRRDGTFSDLDTGMQDGQPNWAKNSQVIVSADCHFSRMSGPMWESMYGMDGILPTFAPDHHIMHDILDGYTVNRHERDDHYRFYSEHMKRKYHTGSSRTRSVTSELQETASKLDTLVLSSPHTKHYVIISNHDQWLRDWAKNYDPKRDPENIEEWHRVNLDILEQCMESAGKFYGESEHYLEKVLHRHGLDHFMDRLRFVGNGAGLKIGGVEYSCHGDKGLGGHVGSIASFSKATGRITIAHTHSPAILWDAHRVGMGAELNQGYNVGMTSWSHSFGIHYATGGRAIITMDDDRWFMGGPKFEGAQA